MANAGSGGSGGEGNGCGPLADPMRQQHSPALSCTDLAAGSDVGGRMDYGEYHDVGGGCDEDISL
uniref:Uncharacterized protein n=1 Tax=Oryza sativa subsp. japonica TaxID=39947 RepID=Q6ESK4_ORYSJ|nr:hypothetical protein [Oryza sativa Japonica Group]